MNKYKVSVPVMYKCYVFADNEEEALENAKRFIDYEVISEYEEYGTDVQLVKRGELKNDSI